MPGRITPLITNEIYHVYNRGIDRQPTFTTKREMERSMNTISYYRFKKPVKKLSYFLLLSSDEKRKTLEQMVADDNRLIDILAFCLMPNHFHFILKQLLDNGISKFLSQFQNSYTRYFNTKHERDGALFLNQFKAVRIETEEQLLHVVRYVHLNPLTSYVVKDFVNLKKYPWSSFSEYLNIREKTVSSPNIVLASFKNSKAYEIFVKDQADYQRKLHLIKHLLLE